MKKFLIPVLIIIFGGMFALGIVRKEFIEVLRNAVVICYSCIGIQ